MIEGIRGIAFQPGSRDPSILAALRSVDAGNLVAKKGDAVEKKFMGPLFRLALFALIALPSIAIVNGCSPLHDRGCR